MLLKNMVWREGFTGKMGVLIFNRGVGNISKKGGLKKKGVKKKIKRRMGGAGCDPQQNYIRQ